ncbi:uncharacterized protein LOC120339981 [Styela clava]
MQEVSEHTSGILLPLSFVSVPSAEDGFVSLRQQSGLIGEDETPAQTSENWRSKAIRRKLSKLKELVLFVGGLPKNLDKSDYIKRLSLFSSKREDACIGPIFPDQGCVFISFTSGMAAAAMVRSLHERKIFGRMLNLIFLPFISVPTGSPTFDPLLVFINSKSGGGQGKQVYDMMKGQLNKNQVFLLEMGGPMPGLYAFRKLPRFRILVCGGDGTAGWVLSALEQLHRHLTCKTPPIAVLPLGTGNDLARVLGFGSGWSGESMTAVLGQVQEANPVRMDRWTILFDTQPEPPSTTSSTKHQKNSNKPTEDHAHNNNLQNQQTGKQQNGLVNGHKPLQRTCKADPRRSRVNIIMGLGDHVEWKTADKFLSPTEEEPENLNTSNNLNSQLVNGDNHGIKPMPPDTDSMPLESDIAPKTHQGVENEIAQKQNNGDSKSEQSDTTSVPHDTIVVPEEREVAQDSDKEIKMESSELQTVSETETIMSDNSSLPPKNDLFSEANKEIKSELNSHHGSNGTESSLSDTDAMPQMTNSMPPMQNQEENKRETNNSDDNDSEGLEERFTSDLSLEEFKFEASTDDKVNTVENKETMSENSPVTKKKNESSVKDSQRKSAHRKLQILSSSDILEDNDTMPFGPLRQLSHISRCDSIESMGDLEECDNPDSMSAIPDEYIAKQKAEEDLVEILRSELPDIVNDKQKLMTLLTSDNADSELDKMIKTSQLEDDEIEQSALTENVMPLLEGDASNIGNDLVNTSTTANLYNCDRRYSDDPRQRAVTSLEDTGRNRGYKKKMSLPLITENNLFYKTSNDGLTEIEEEETPVSAPSGPKVVTMNNYLGIGIDAEVSLAFHIAREENPEKFSSRLHNKAVYLKAGLKKLATRSTSLNNVVDLEVDGQKLPLSSSIKGLIFCNISSWGGGGNAWGSSVSRRFKNPSMGDGLLEVVGVGGVAHMSQMYSGIRNGFRIAQGEYIRLHLKSELAVQVDGEPWLQPPGQIIITVSALQVMMLKRQKKKTR